MALALLTRYCVYFDAFSFSASPAAINTLFPLSFECFASKSLQSTTSSLSLYMFLVDYANENNASVLFKSLKSHSHRIVCFVYSLCTCIKPLHIRLERKIPPMVQPDIMRHRKRIAFANNADKTNTCSQSWSMQLTLSDPIFEILTTNKQ